MIDNTAASLGLEPRRNVLAAVHSSFSSPLLCYAGLHPCKGLVYCRPKHHTIQKDAHTHNTFSVLGVNKRSGRILVGKVSKRQEMAGLLALRHTQQTRANCETKINRQWCTRSLPDTHARPNARAHTHTKNKHMATL